MKHLLVFDATPLIYLSKTKILDKIKELKTENIILESIYKEVVEEGSQKGKEDAFYVRKLIEQQIFQVKKSSLLISSFKENKNLSDADKEILIFCKENNGIVIADDEEIRSIAEIEEIENHGSLYILFTLLREKCITKEKLKQILDSMIQHGWYCSIEFYNEIIKQLDKIT